MGIRNSKKSLNIASASKSNGTEPTVTVKEIKDVPEVEQPADLKQEVEATTELKPVNGGTVEAETPTAVEEPVSITSFK